MHRQVAQSLQNKAKNLKQIYSTLNCTQEESCESSKIDQFAIELIKKRIQLLKHVIALLPLCEERNKSSINTGKTKKGLAIALSVVNGLISGFVSYLGTLKLLSLTSTYLGLFTNLAALAVGAIDMFAATIFALWDMHKDYGIKAFFRADKYTRLISKELMLHKMLVDYATNAVNKKSLKRYDQDTLNKICLLNFKSLNQHDKNLRIPKQRQALGGSLKWTYLALSGGLKFASGLLIAKSVLGFLGLVSLAFPITAAIGVVLGLIISSVFVLTKAKSTHNVISAMFDKNVSEVKEKLNRHLHIKQSENSFVSQMNLLKGNNHFKKYKPSANDSTYIKSQLKSKSVLGIKKITVHKYKKPDGNFTLKGGHMFRKTIPANLKKQHSYAPKLSKLAI